MAGRENLGKYNTNTESSSSGSASPTDDLSADPDYKCKVKTVVPSKVSTRQHIVLENNKSDLKYRSKAIQNLHLHSGDIAMTEIPPEFTPISIPVDSSSLSSAILGAAGVSKPQKGNMSDDDFK